MQQSIASCFELYLGRADIRPATLRFKRQALRYFVEWFGDMPIGDVAPAVIEDYRTLLAKEGRSKRTANGYMAVFRPFFGWLRRHGRIALNPFDGVSQYKLTDRPKETFTPAELGRLLKVSDDLWRIRICLGLLGCRRGEMLNVVSTDIHLEETVPHILLSPKVPGPNTWGWELKDHAIRYVALPQIMQFDGAAVDLHGLIRVRLQELPLGTPYAFLEARYCKRHVGETWVPDPTGNFQRMFRQVQKHATVTPARRFHELRAAFATVMIGAVGLSRTADLLGHASVQTTRGYDRHSEMSLLSEISLVAQKCYVS